jgi:hypothetical protein
LDLDSVYGGLSSWFEEMVITMSWITWLYISIGAFDSYGLVAMVMFMMVL